MKPSCLFPLQYLLFIFLLLFPAGAFATKARLMSLGQSHRGSFFIEDNRNIFLNPAEVNNYRDFLTFEFGKDLPGTTVESDYRSRAEGGVIFQGRSLTYGLFLGAEDDHINGVRRSIDARLPGDDNKVDFFIGGESGFKWGVNIGISQLRDERGGDLSKSNVLLSHVGFIGNNWDFFTKVIVNSSAEFRDLSDDFKLESNADIMIGGKRKFESITLYGSAQYADYELDIRKNLKFLHFITGVGKDQYVTEKTRIFTNIEADYFKNSNEDQFLFQIPLKFALEFEASSWLMLRSSIGQVIISRGEDHDSAPDGGGKYLVSDSTAMTVGASIVMDSLHLDFMAGRVALPELLVYEQVTTYRMSLSYSY